MSTPIRLVCFDWGGVLLRICRSWAQGCRAAALDVRGGSAEESSLSCRREIARRFELGLMGPDEFFQSIARATDGLYSPGEIADIHHAWLIEEYPGVDALITRLHGRPGVTTALLSNTNEAHWHRQEQALCAPRRHFPAAASLRFRLASHLTGVAKPDARFYRTLETLSGHRGGEILFFDDLADNIAAARGLGWNAELIDHSGDTAAQMASHLHRYGVLD